MKFQECQHVFANGVTCHAPRLRQHRFCYFHVAARDRIRRQRLAAEKNLPLQMPVLENDVTIQLALGDVVNAMLCDRIDARKAALALYALQTASANLKHARVPSGQFYREYTPELDASLPDLPPSPPEAVATAKQPEARSASTTVEEAPSKVPPKKPVASAPVKSALGSGLIQTLRKWQRAEAKAIRRYLPAFKAGTAEPLPWVIKKHDHDKNEVPEPLGRGRGRG